MNVLAEINKNSDVRDRRNFLFLDSNFENIVWRTEKVAAKVHKYQPISLVCDILLLVTADVLFGNIYLGADIRIFTRSRN